MSRPVDRVARHVEQALRGRRPARFAASAEEREALLGAGLIAAAGPRGIPDPAFLERLHQRLERELEPRPRSRRVSRRALLGAAGAALAAAAAGGLAVYEQGLAPREPPPAAPDGATWLVAASVADLPRGAVLPFSTAAMHLLLANDGHRIRALSGACTHLGCLLRPGAGAIACPCHRTSFGLDGHVLSHQLPQAPPPLPELPVRVVAGRVEVLAV